MKPFIKGADISFLEEQLAQGAVFKDRDGTPTEIYALLKKYGINGVRFRIWNEPENVPQSGGYCSVAKTIEAAKIAKANGMHIMLDFHYSDFWADPQQQNKPKAWEHLNFEELVSAVYDFTKQTLLQFHTNNVVPGIVQIGNEIRNGMLWEDGMLTEIIRLGLRDKPDANMEDYKGKPTHYANLAKLVNAGIRATREVCENSEIMIHLDEGANFPLLSKWLDEMNTHGLADFDVLGLSYYPHFHGKIASLAETVNKLAIQYKKPIFMVETAHPWRILADGFVSQEALMKTGFPASPEAQKDVLDQVFAITANIPNGLGRGVYFWEPAIIATQSGYSANMGVFDENGVALPALESFLFTAK